MKKFIILIIILNLITLTIFSKSLNQKEIALNILKYEMLSIPLKEYKFHLNKNKFSISSYEIKHMENYYFDIKLTDLIEIKQNLSKEINIYALPTPQVHPFLYIVAVDKQGLFYYLSSTKKDNIEQLFLNNKIKYTKQIIL